MSPHCLSGFPAEALKGAVLMKKRTFLPLVACVALALAVPVLAGENSGLSTPSSTTIPVTGTYQSNDGSTPVYSVDIAWGDMAFTYTAGGGTLWDPTTHTYTQSTAPAGWSYSPATETSLAGNQITLTNHSNASVSYTATFALSDTLAGSNVTGAVSPQTATLPLVAPETPLNDPNITTSLFLTMSGDLPSNFSAGGSLGTITISLGTV